MIAILSGLDAPPPPPPPVYHPKTAGIIYEGHAHGQPWRYSNAATSASTPSDHVNKAVAAIDLEGEDMNPTDGGVATVDQLEKLFDKAADTSDLAQVLNRFGLEPEDPMELVVGEAEEGDLTTDERARTDIHCVNPHEFIADAISDALFDGLTWESVQGARQKLVLRPTRFSYEKSGKRCEVEILGEAPRTIIGQFGKRAVDPTRIRKILNKDSATRCCKGNCLHRWVDGLGEEAPVMLEGHRHAVAAMSELGRQHYFVRTIQNLLVPKMRVGTHGEGNVLVGYETVKFRVNSNVDLCQVAYASIMGISTRSLQRYTSWAREKGGTANRGKPMGFVHRKTAAARCWLINYATSHDIMPNSSTKGVSTVILDVPRKCDAWYCYAMCMLRAGHPKSEILTYKVFLRMWADDFPWVKTRKAKTIESKCETCEDIENLLKKYIHSDAGVVAALRLFQYDHILFQQAERNMYYLKRQLAQDYPKEIASMICDGMQQATCQIPRKRYHAYDKERLEQKLVAVLAHGSQCQDLHLYRCFPHLPGGANAIITCLWRSICTLIEAGRFPKDGKLYLQLDGASDNVNQQMPRFASWLCQQKICRTVVISRLPVGHTHEDIDQKFSVISRALRAHDIITPQEFEDRVRGSFRDIMQDSNARLRCTFTDLWAIWDFKRWFTSHGENPLGAWPNIIGNWAKKRKAALSVRLGRSKAHPDKTDKIYVQTRRFCAPKVRQVLTRDEAENKLAFPSYRDATVVWEPNDSQHRGKLFLQHHLQGSPKYVEFCQSEGPKPEWYDKLTRVWADMMELYEVSNVFDDERKEHWEDFWALFPWGGLKDLRPEDVPEFRIPAFPSQPMVADTSGDHDMAVGILSQVGVDSDGRRRAYFKNGKDLMKYPRDESYVTYGDFLLNGQRYHPPNKGKRSFQGAFGQPLYAGQHVAVLSSGLHEATELLSKFKSIEDLHHACEGWWLATVVKIVRADGSEEEPADFSARAVEKMSLERLGKGRRKKKKLATTDKEEGDDKTTAGGIAQASSNPVEAADDSSPPITKARVMWMGLENVHDGDGRVPLCCKPSKEMRSLGITDVISRSHLVYEEEDHLHIRFTTKGLLYKPSVERIRKALPKILPRMPCQDDDDAEDGDLAQVEPDQGYNHAGIYVGGNDVPGTAGDQDRWDATFEEVGGFRWSADPEPEEPEPPTFEVVGLRRARGQVFCIVRTCQGDKQQDHPLEIVRRRIYDSVMENVKSQVPFMMQWPRLRDSSLILDPTIILANALHYEKVMRSKPTIGEDDELPGLRDPNQDGRHDYVTRRDMVLMFTQNDNPSHRGKGHYILQDPIVVFVKLLRDKMSRQPTGGGPRVLVASLTHYQGTGLADAFDFHCVVDAKTRETARAKTLRLMLGQGHSPSTPPSDYVEEMYDHYDKVLLPCFVHGCHFIIFEVALMSDLGRYVKVWDGMEPESNTPTPQWRQEINAIMEVFFSTEAPAEVILRQPGDPSQGRGFGCGPFAALTMAYLSHGMMPPIWSERDEAVARNYLWACIHKRVVLPLPKQRL